MPILAHVHQLFSAEQCHAYIYIPKLVTTSFTLVGNEADRVWWGPS
jgi:hypothetical protein